MDKPAVLVAGIGGASLGTEVLKSLRDSGRYRIYGCDTSEWAYGHYHGICDETYTVTRDAYIQDILKICESKDIRVIIPGGEQPLQLLGRASTDLAAQDLILAANSQGVIEVCTDKAILFDALHAAGVSAPWTHRMTEPNLPSDLPLPCIIKPSTQSGGSRHTFLASTEPEARMYVEHLYAIGVEPVVQKYIPVSGGEFTVGVLSLPTGDVVGSVAMKRLFHSQLSVAVETDEGLISSGYSQGLIEDFPAVCDQAERIARTIGSTGPLNIQGRVHEGALLPFEINPRFSASTYLRTLAGFNEVDIYLQFLLYGQSPGPISIRPGIYLRSFTETHVARDQVKW